MPNFLFKKYLKTLIVDVENDLKSILTKILTEASRFTNEDSAVLVDIYLFYDYPDVTESECRVWMYKNTTYLVCDSKVENNENIYRINAEIFEVTPIQMFFDLEKLSNLGYSIRQASFDKITYLAKNIADELGITMAETHADTENGKEEKGHAEDSYYSEKECLELVYMYSLDPECDYTVFTSPEEQVDRCGFTAVGEGSEYVCIIRDSKGCPYLFVRYDSGKTETVCYSNKKSALSRLYGYRKHILFP